MKLFIRLDAWLLERIQMFVNWTSKILGLQKTVLTKMALSFSVAMILISIKQEILIQGKMDLFVAYVLMIPVFLFITATVSEKLGEDSPLMIYTVQKIEVIRKVFLGLICIFVLLEILQFLFLSRSEVAALDRGNVFRYRYEISFSFTEFALYVLSCASPPKQKSWTKEKIEQLKSSLAQQELAPART